MLTQCTAVCLLPSKQRERFQCMAKKSKMICMSPYVHLSKLKVIFSVFRRFGVIFTTRVSQGALSFRLILPTLTICSSSYTTYRKSNDTICLQCGIAFLPYRQLNESCQSRSQDLILLYFNFYEKDPKSEIEF